LSPAGSPEKIGMGSPSTVTSPNSAPDSPPLVTADTAMAMTRARPRTPPRMYRSSLLFISCLAGLGGGSEACQQNGDQEKSGTGHEGYRHDPEHVHVLRRTGVGWVTSSSCLQVRAVLDEDVVDADADADDRQRQPVGTHLDRKSVV